jgi:cytochrome b561
MALHWVIAALILVQMGLGWYMNEVVPDHTPAQDRIQDIHVSVGLTILLLVIVRVVNRLLTRIPPLPAGLAKWESGLARALHILLYALLIVLPISGWLLMTVRHEPIAFWGLPVPGLPGLQGLTGPAHRPFSRLVKHWHIFILIWAAWVMIALHVAGALKHQFDGHPVLWRMLPFVRRPALLP